LRDFITSCSTPSSASLVFVGPSSSSPSQAAAAAAAAPEPLSFFPLLLQVALFEYFALSPATELAVLVTQISPVRQKAT
jgi:hypothetical protein